MSATAPSRRAVSEAKHKSGITRNVDLFSIICSDIDTWVILNYTTQLTISKNYTILQFQQINLFHNIESVMNLQFLFVNLVTN